MENSPNQGREVILQKGKNRNHPQNTVDTEKFTFLANDRTTSLYFIYVLALCKDQLSATQTSSYYAVEASEAANVLYPHSAYQKCFPLHFKKFHHYSFLLHIKPAQIPFDEYILDSIHKSESW